jgi:hypothetical protein
VAKNKLIGKAAFWLDTERRGGAKTDLWDIIHANPNSVPPIPHTRIGLKDGLIAMFKVDISQLEATEAVMDLVMKSNKTINVFYVRVKWTMEVKNHSISMEDKALAPYIEDRDRDLFNYFMAGLPPKYLEFAMSGENPPTDPTTLRKRCAQLEAMQSRTKRIAALSAKVNEDNPKAIKESPIELLTKEIAALKAEMKCFNCQKKGHFVSACPDPKKHRSAQGLCNSPASFQRLLDFINTGLPGVFVYLDNVVIVSTTYQQHQGQLRQLLTRFRKYGRVYKNYN